MVRTRPPRQGQNQYMRDMRTSLSSTEDEIFDRGDLYFWNFALNDWERLVYPKRDHIDSENGWMNRYHTVAEMSILIWGIQISGIEPLISSIDYILELVPRGWRFPPTETAFDEDDEKEMKLIDVCESRKLEQLTKFVAAILSDYSEARIGT